MTAGQVALWAVIAVTCLLMALTMSYVVTAAVEVRQTMESLRAVRDLRTWMCSWCSATPLNCRCNPSVPTSVEPRVWICTQCSESPAGCECSGSFLTVTL
ncbi:hypothetical protein [Actinomadura geliboluensis]|uniref:hypothetical protein n=1 Tax=Actinomadura geliboluensis TaxID=882440 RepID=UPI002630A11B|nr:hypothetical protein [Actinomadura geliboluensis]